MWRSDGLPTYSAISRVTVQIRSSSTMRRILHDGLRPANYCLMSPGWPRFATPSRCCMDLGPNGKHWLKDCYIAPLRLLVVDVRELTVLWTSLANRGPPLTRSCR